MSQKLRGIAILVLTSLCSLPSPSARAATFKSFPCETYLEEESANARLIRSMEGQMRLGYEFELFPMRIKFLMPYINRARLKASLERVLGSDSRRYSEVIESEWSRYPMTALKSRELKEVYQRVTGQNWDRRRSVRKLLAELPFEHWPDELVAQLIVDAKIVDKIEWKRSAPAALRTFSWGLDAPSVELRTRARLKTAVAPFEGMRMLVQLTKLYDAFYVNTLKDDVTEGAEYHYHVSFPGNPLYGERLEARAEAINRLYLLENMALGPDHNAALTIQWERFNISVRQRGLIRLPAPGTGRLESRWHYADPETELADLIRYVQMDDDEFRQAARARETVLIRNGTHVIRRLRKLSPLNLGMAFKDWSQDPYFKAEVRAADAEKQSAAGSKP